MAADISVRGVPAAEVGAFARKTLGGRGGVGIYEKQNFTHVDVRAKRADWKK